MTRIVTLEKYHPDVTKEYRECQQIAWTENPEFNLLWSKIDDVFHDEFIYDFTENGASRWEKMLKLRPRDNDSLDTRRIRIIAKISRMLPYTHRRLEQILAVICGEGKSSFRLNYNRYSLNVKLDEDIMSIVPEVSELLGDIVPANLNSKIAIDKTFSTNLYVAQAFHRIKQTTIYPSIALPKPTQSIKIGHVMHVAKIMTIYPGGDLS